MNFICSCTIGAATAAASSSIDRERERKRGQKYRPTHDACAKSCFNTCRVDLLAPHSHSRGWQSLHREVSWFTISHLRPPRSLCVYILECCLTCCTVTRHAFCKRSPLPPESKSPPAAAAHVQRASTLCTRGVLTRRDSCSSLHLYCFGLNTHTHVHTTQIQCICSRHSRRQRKGGELKLQPP